MVRRWFKHKGRAPVAEESIATAQTARPRKPRLSNQRDGGLAWWFGIQGWKGTV